MKRLLLIFSMLISFCYSDVSRADGTEKIYVDPKIAQQAIEKHFSRIATEYFGNTETEIDNNTILANVVDAYNHMLKLNDGFVSVDGIVNVCKTAFSDFHFTYNKDSTLADRVKLIDKKCHDFVRDLVLETYSKSYGSNCPYTVTKVDGSQAKIKYTLPDNSGFIRSGGSIAWRFFNPGNLRSSGLQCTTIRTSRGRFAVFQDAETGRFALHRLLFESSAYSNLTVRRAIYKYAPPSQNNTKGYINKLRKGGVNVDAKLSDLSDAEKIQLEEMIMMIEGWNKVGTETRF